MRGILTSLVLILALQSGYTRARPNEAEPSFDVSVEWGDVPSTRKATLQPGDDLRLIWVRIKNTSKSSQTFSLFPPPFFVVIYTDRNATSGPENRSVRTGGCRRTENIFRLKAGETLFRPLFVTPVSDTWRRVLVNVSIQKGIRDCYDAFHSKNEFTLDRPAGEVGESGPVEKHQ